MRATTIILILGFVTGKRACASFDIVSFNKTTKQRVKVGQSVDLSCIANYNWDFCKFTSPSGKWCELKYNSAGRVVEVNNCDDFKGRYNFTTTDYNYYGYKCEIRFYKMEEEDSGNWTCLLDDYESYRGEGYGCYRCGKQTEKSLYINVTTGKTTTPEIIGKVSMHG